jgi:phage gp36-like protein
MYITIDDIKLRNDNDTLIKMTNDDDASDVVNEIRLQVAIDDAEAIMNKYISESYKLPLSEVPAYLIIIACNITIYLLYDARSLTISENIQKKYNDAIKTLEEIKNGETTIEAEPLISINDMILSNKTKHSKVFNPKVLRQIR